MRASTRTPQCSRRSLLYVIGALCMVLLFGSIMIAYEFSKSRAGVRRSEQIIGSHQKSLSMLAHHFNNRSLHQFSDWLDTHASTLQRPIIPIVIYVHARPHYLRQVLDAIGQAHMMDRNIVIISHDSVESAMLELVGSYLEQSPGKIGYILQLVYPDLKPDFLGFGDRSQLKHHWWWCLHTVFYELANGPLRPWLTPTRQFLFLEEDLQVTRDFYLSALAMADSLAIDCPWPQCWGFSLYPHSSLAYPAPPSSSSPSLLSSIQLDSSEPQSEAAVLQADPLAETPPPLAHPPEATPVALTPSLARVHPQVGFSTAAYVLSQAAFHHLSQASAKSEFYHCLDGFDMALVHLQLMDMFPSRFVSLVPSRVQDVGVVGLHMRRAIYRERQLDRIRLSNVKDVSLQLLSHIVRNQTKSLPGSTWPDSNSIPFFGKC